MNDFSDFQRALDPREVGEQVTLKLDRDGSLREVRLELASVN